MYGSIVLSLLPLLAYAAPRASPLVVHQKRDARSDQQWKKVLELDSGAVIPFRFGLKQSNLDRGHDWLMDIADPASPNYGQHWTPEQIVDAFKPSEETVNIIHDWLNDAGIETARHRFSAGLSWLEVDMTAEEAEALMNAKYHVFSHKSTGTQHVACDHYSVPQHVQPHIDFISPGVHFDARVGNGKYEEYDGMGNKLAKRQWGPGGPGWPGHHGPGPWHHTPPWHHPPPSNAHVCNDSFVTPYCIRTLYDIPTDLTPAEGNSVGIVEYTPETYLQSDLDKFFAAYDPQAEGAAPIFKSIDGGFLYRGYNSTTAFEYLGEPSLDLQYAMSILYPQKVTYFQVGDLPEEVETSFNNFLDAIDKSYCTYDGGDQFPYDAKYPDPSNAPHSYKGTPNCGKYPPTKVISTSYGTDEAALPPSYMERQCHEYMKLGLQGVTFAYSSGDFGVAGDVGQCLGSNGKLNNGKSGQFLPDFPATCPYVLGVGATQIINGTTNVVEQIQAGKQVEMAMELYTLDGLVYYDVPPGKSVVDQLIVSSSGGYSNVFPLPSYQKSAVTAYNSKYRPSYPGQYNTSAVRAFPDVSSNGAWLSIVIDGEFAPVFGTSCAAPTWGAILGLINGERIKAGKGSVGFINPALYANPSVLHDVTLGSNPGCGTNGFTAVEGWDPVTGLGTPNFPALLKYFMNLK